MNNMTCYLLNNVFWVVRAYVQEFGFSCVAIAYFVAMAYDILNLVFIQFW